MFTGSCKPLDLPCRGAQASFVDPCNCTSFYECFDEYSMPVLKHCPPTPPGLPWREYANYNCYVTQYGCTESAPWNMCKNDGVSPDELLKLKNRCLSQMSTISPSVSTTPEPASEPADTGLIVGALIGALILVVLVILLALLYYRWKDKIKLPRFGKKAKENTHSEPNEFYDTLDVHSMRYSVSSETPVIPVRPVHTFPYSERPNSELRPPHLTSPNTPVTPKDNTFHESYTALDNSLQQINQVPTVYSLPYEPIEVARSIDTHTASQDFQPQPDYVDFGYYNTLAVHSK